MNSDLKSVKTGVFSQAGSIAKKAGQLAAQEPLEVIKSAKSQVANEYSPQSTVPNPSELAPKSVGEIDEEEIKRKDLQRIRELEEEMAGFKRAREEKWAEIKKQQELEKAQEESHVDMTLPQISSKPSRKLFTGIKGRVEKLKKRTEIRMPPSG